MSRILDVNELLCVGKELIPENEFRGYLTTLEAITTALAQRIADADADTTMTAPAEWQDGFGGLCAAFQGSPKCHQLIIDYDPSGECS